MKNILKKTFNLSDMKYSWLLLLSMVIFILSLYFEKLTSSITPLTQWVTYGSAFLSAVIWSVLNYIAHIKVNANYKKYDDIKTYVDNLVMSKDDKLELMAYLEDYATDLSSQGKTKAEAVQIAINQFRVQEFSSISKNNSVLNLPIHYYLIGYVLVDIALVIVLALLTNTVFHGYFWLSAFEFTLAAYGVGFLGLFFLYKVFDAAISKKINN